MQVASLHSAAVILAQDGQHILAVHRCLHRALAQAVTWRLVARNAATDATPPPVPPTEVAALAPEQVGLLLDAADVGRAGRCSSGRTQRSGHRPCRPTS